MKMGLALNLEKYIREAVVIFLGSQGSDVFYFKRVKKAIKPPSSAPARLFLIRAHYLHIRKNMCRERRRRVVLFFRMMHFIKFQRELSC